MKDQFELEMREKIRQQLVKCRNERGISQTELGQLIGKSKNAVASWEQGDASPDAAMLYKIALLYGKSIQYMYGLEGSDDLSN